MRRCLEAFYDITLFVTGGWSLPQLSQFTLSQVDLITCAGALSLSPCVSCRANTGRERELFTVTANLESP